MKNNKKEEGVATLVGCTALNILTAGISSPFTARKTTRALNNMKRKKAERLLVSANEGVIKETPSKKEVTTSNKTDKATEPKTRTTAKKTVKKAVKA